MDQMNMNLDTVSPSVPDIFNANSQEMNNVVSADSINLDNSYTTTASDSVMVVSDQAGYTINEDNKWGWITLYVVTIVVAVLGNLLFIIGSLCTRRSRNTGHYLLINLSIRDILLAGLCIPAALDSEIIHLTWNLGLPYCISYR